MALETIPIRWGVVDDGVPIGDIWREGDTYFSAVYLPDGSRYPCGEYLGTRMNVDIVAVLVKARRASLVARAVVYTRDF